MSVHGAGLEDITDVEFAQFHGVAQRKRGYLRAKRVLDFTLALILLSLAAPFLLLVAVIVRLDSPGPALYRARRYGLAGKPFAMLKFRSMAVAPAAQDAAFRSGVSRDGVLAKSAADPRLTRVGRVIRKLSVDELPQLINVVRGEMALVGPRPVLPEMLDRYPVFGRTRMLVRPGLGGLWQVRARANATHVGFMWQHDLEYLRRMSLALDIQILARTVMAALSGTGAH